jgi:hypothetical protein
MLKLFQEGERRKNDGGLNMTKIYYKHISKYKVCPLGNYYMLLNKLKVSITSLLIHVVYI